MVFSGGWGGIERTSADRANPSSSTTSQFLGTHLGTPDLEAALYDVLMSYPLNEERRFFNQWMGAMKGFPEPRSNRQAQPKGSKPTLASKPKAEPPSGPLPPSLTSPQGDLF